MMEDIPEALPITKEEQPLMHITLPNTKVDKVNNANPLFCHRD
jgi:hypothetical protein